MQRHVIALALLWGCSPSGGTNKLVLQRPYDIDVPASYDSSKSYPLIMLLHGYGQDGFIQDAYFGFSALADDRGVLVAHPDGTVDSTGSHFWNATDACCNRDGSSVDDVAYLKAVVDDVRHRYHVDDKHLFFVGHSNGGYMSHRMACDDTAEIAAIVALAGDVWKDPSRCSPTRPIAVMQVHGDLDTEVPYAGDDLDPSAAESVGTWAAKNGCTGGLQDTGLTYHLDGSLPPNETSRAAWSCPAGAAVLETIHMGTHVPRFLQPDWGNHVLDWLMEYSR
jgi:polyhydroxybutyrate depolymerase